MPGPKKKTPYDDLLIDTAVGLDMDVEAVRAVVKAFFMSARSRLIDGGGFRVPHFGTFSHKYLAARRYNTREGSTGIVQTRTSRPSVGVRYVPSRRMVQRMREEWRAGRWKG